MKRPINRRAAAGGARVRHRPESARLDPIALEAIERFTRVLAHCGGAPRDLAAAFEAACHRIPPAAAVGAEGATPEMSDASHVLTIWYSDPQYTNPDGVPSAVPLRGTAPSLEALVRSVDPKLKVEVVLRYLLRVRALRREGRRYAPRSRSLALRGTGGPTNFRNLRGLTAMLRTLEHNGRPKRLARGWFEVFAENPRFPAEARAAFDTRLDRLGMEFLQAIDADMHRRELARKPSEATVRIGVGVYRFEDEVGDEAAIGARNTDRPAQRTTQKRRRSK
jgi:hypothetical protein